MPIMSFAICSAALSPLRVPNSFRAVQLPAYLMTEIGEAWSGMR